MAFGVSFGIALPGGSFTVGHLAKLPTPTVLRLALIISAINAMMIFLLQLVLWKKIAPIAM
jgi:hypothetical protein